ncbi:MAG: hypothetical protein ACXVCI_05880 [Bdellovibrionota bacterium]
MPQLSSHSESLTDHYLALLDRYAQLITAAGKTLRRSSPEQARALFEKVDEPRRKALLARLEAEISIFEETLAAGEKLTDSKKLLWRHFSRSRFAPCSQLFDKIRDTDVVEIYGLDQIHLFQNLAFFDWISVTLEQIFCEAWYVLTKRDPGIEKMLYEIAQKIAAGGLQETIDPGVPWHLVEELNSEKMMKFQYKLKYVSPVVSAGQLCAFVVVSEAKKA